ncbi:MULTISPECIES: diguanylate cyclase [unclassified Roseitalea]|uniref:GGDEF domain-containing protein n=1 Tax=unclassified Roseitalea TaxID=2639107 RepID=UPI00273D9CCC|nr:MULTISPECIES: diguanylate cyclase [unclassified Roseitalea]
MTQQATAQQPLLPVRRDAGPDDPFRLSDEALELARQYDTPPEPEVYNVWYAYASGRCPDLNRRIETLIARGAEPSTYDLAEIGQEVLVDNDADRLARQANEHLQSEMDGVLSFIRSYLDSAERYQGAIDTSTQSLNSASTPAELEMMIALVIRENQRIRAQTRQLSDSLRETQNEIVALQEKLEKSREAELHDPMTGLPNRRYFQRAFEAELRNAQEAGTPLTFALADIDHFKSVNDRFGHQIGDEVLKFVGNHLRDRLGSHGSVSRYGGEEFAIILPDMARAQASAVLDEARSHLSEARLVTSRTRKPIGEITISIGIADFRADDTAASLFRRADEQLYGAKDGGRNRVM